jgi:hypothetical protein
MSAFEELTKAQAAARSEPRLSETLGLSRSAGFADTVPMSGRMESSSRAIEEAMGMVGLGASRRKRASEELSSIVDALGGKIGGLGRASSAEDVFGSTVAEALGTGGLGASRRKRASEELSSIVDALGGKIGGLGRPSRARDVFGSTIAEALGAGIGGHAKAHERLREAFAEPRSDSIGREKIERHLAEAGSSAARPEPIPERIPLPRPAPNPVHETNRHLRQVAEKIDALLEVQAQQAKLIDALLQAQVAAGRDQNRIWRRDHRFTVMGLALSLLAVLVSVIF